MENFHKLYFEECPAKYEECSIEGDQMFPFRVFISLTTSPKRLHALYSVLPSLHLPCVYFIVLNIPDSFKGETYNEMQLIQLCKDFPQLYINHFGSDIGPLSKLVPTIKVADKPTDVIITVDDDTLYTSDVIIDLCKLHVQRPNVVISHQAGPNIWNLKLTNVLGFQGVLYPVNVLNAAVVNTMLEYNRIPQCKIHDDMTITMALYKHNIQIIGNEVNKRPCQVSLGFEDPNALWKLGNHYWKHPSCVWRIWGFLS